MGRKKLGFKNQVRLSDDELDLIVILRACRVSPADILLEAGKSMPLVATIYEARKEQRRVEQQGEAAGKPNEARKGEDVLQARAEGAGEEKPASAGGSLAGGFAGV